MMILAAVLLVLGWMFLSGKIQIKLTRISDKEGYAKDMGKMLLIFALAPLVTGLISFGILPRKLMIVSEVLLIGSVLGIFGVQKKFDDTI